MNHIERLPTELLDAIVAYLESSELLPLLSCSLVLRSYTICVLSRRENGKDILMRWACLNGHLPIIRSLVSHGASASTIDIEWNHWDRRRERWVERRSKILTLCVAAARKQVQAFQLLLQLGARIDCPGVERRELPRLLDRICDPVVDWALLRLFYEHGLHTQVCITHYPQLRRVIHRQASAATRGPVQMLLEKGISPNECHVRHGFNPSTPLATAFRLKDRSTVDILLRHGAHIDGPSLTHSVRRPWPIPIFVAAEDISTYGFELIRICLENGADINYCAWERIRDSWGCYKGPDHYLTPFLIYLDSISTWETRKLKVEPVQAISFLVDQGAWVEQPLNPPFEGQVHGARLNFTPWGFEFLLKKWGPTALRDYDGFRTTIYFLLQKAVENETLGESLARYDYPVDRWGRIERDGEVPSIWQELLTYLLDVQQVDPTTLLYQYILYKGRFMEWQGDISRATIDRLLAAGGNIHARLQPDSPTVLEELCRTYNYQERGRLLPGRALGYRWDEWREEFVQFLVSKGITDGPVSAAHDLLLFDLDGLYEGAVSRLWLLAGILGKKRTVVVGAKS
ncbi:hypothetical protein P170DRAFT_409358 [Aspergillus steynii IBT 23096]|uniref:F-box domain-containing protein n=1 Tax=Aspergillus steynii IBT 23096 TaxID=1392250 RepID=A0A2I2GA61_9EURO|nr:uncharacterized protein P170DRAFT_409358 [Aspergillus steynii IBT 23096]PLB49765.1 hypothetical protein P170DRAFT_409358 [Aspergillus steynii IBT 23096]